MARIPHNNNWFSVEQFFFKLIFVKQLLATVEPRILVPFPLWNFIDALSILYQNKFIDKETVIVEKEKNIPS